MVTITCFHLWPLRKIGFAGRGVLITGRFLETDYALVYVLIVDDEIKLLGTLDDRPTYVIFIVISNLIY